MKFTEYLNEEKKLDKNKFEKFLQTGQSFQIGDDTLWLSSENKWMLNMKVSTFDILYNMYKKAKDVQIND